jgi:hypothetical protein
LINDLTMFALLVRILAIGGMGDSSDDDDDDGSVVRDHATADIDGNSMGSKFNRKGIARFDFKI